MAYVALACSGLIGTVFLVSAFTKLRSGSAFRAFKWWLARLPLPMARSWPGPVAVTMAATEAAIAVLVALPWTVRTGFVLAAVVLVLFTAGTWLAIVRGADEPCQCFGASAWPLAWRHVVRDALLCLVAIAGAAGAGSGGAHAAGIVVRLVAGLVISLPAMFLDDVAVLFTGLADGSSGGDGQPIG